MALPVCMGLCSQSRGVCFLFPPKIFMVGGGNGKGNVQAQLVRKEIASFTDKEKCHS